jgi:putative spermidine/putrescine transport system permease protein
VLSVLSVIRPRDRVLEAAARTLGASPLTAFRRVTLPLLLPGVVAGAVLSFMVSFDDVTLPIFLSGSSAGTLPKAMLDALVLDSDPTVMSASTLVALVGLALFALGSLVSRWLSSRR